MKVTPKKTHKITKKDNDLIAILDEYITEFKENSVLVITSKIVSICEGKMVKVEKADKQSLIKQESSFYLPPETNRYGFTITITRGTLTPTAGIDESNANGYYILWPENPQKTANIVRKYLTKRFNVKYAGVIITDSRTVLMRWGTMGTALAHSGFIALHDYRHTQDIFGRELKVTQANNAEALAAAAVVTMGEGSEQTPLAIIEDLPFVHFQDRNPSQEELDALKLAVDEDLYSPLLTSVKWKQGEK